MMIGLIGRAPSRGLQVRKMTTLPLKRNQSGMIQGLPHQQATIRVGFGPENRHPALDRSGVAHALPLDARPGLPTTSSP